MHILTTLLLAAITLPTGWRVEPAGALVPLDTFPVYAQLAAGGKYALVLQAGFRPPKLAMLDLASRRVVHSLELPDAGANFAYDSALGQAYIPLGHRAAIAVVTVRESGLSLASTIAAPDGHASTIAAGAGQIAVTHTQADVVAIVDRVSGSIVHRLIVSRPTRALFHRGYLYVLSHAPATLHVFRAGGYSQAATVSLSAGPADLAIHGQRLFVAASMTNMVDVLSLSDPAHPQPLGRLNLAPTPNWPVGISPTALSVDAATGRLFVACSDANAIAVVDAGTLQPSGYIPAGWYPTFALPLPRGQLLVLNGKGERSYPNPQGPIPTIHRTMTPQPPSQIQYTPLIQGGSARWIDRLTPQSLAAHSRAFAKLTPTPPVTAAGALPAAIRHVIFVMKENRTYDQVLGDLPIGNGDPSLCLFPERITPNHHRLAREFVLLDNFYVNADVSAEGWYWTSAAIVPPAVMKRWPATYAGRASGGRANTFPRTGQMEPLDQAPGGFLWTAAIRAGLTFRNYGFFVSNRRGAKPGEPIVASVTDPALLPYTSPTYAGYDPGFPDVERARIFLADLAEFEKANSLPQLTVMVLPNDHTWGTAPGKLTPFASMADNDSALGLIVEGVSKSRFWPSTAIFVVEDDAQNGPDHVDSHRSPAYVISPYTRQHRVDSTFYNTTSMLRTIVSLLGMPPMTHYDATSPVMSTVFSANADTRAYTAEPPRVPLDTTNPPLPSAAAYDFSAPDRVDDAVMNQMLWRALRPEPPPPPTRAGFVRARREEPHEAANNPRRGVPPQPVR